MVTFIHVFNQSTGLEQQGKQDGDTYMFFMGSSQCVSGNNSDSKLS